MPTRTRPARLRVIGFALPLLLVLAFAVILAFVALKATRAQRRAADQTLRDYADFAAFIVSNAARQEIERRLLYAFAPLRRYDASTGQPLPPASVIGLDRTESMRCAAAGTPATYMRVTLAAGATDSGDVSISGDVLPDSTVAWLADTLTADALANHADGWSFAHIFAGRADIDLIAYSVLHDADGRPLAIYAKTSCLDVDDKPVFRLATRATRALPPSLTGGVPNDSLFWFRATDPRGRVIQTSATPPSEGVSGHAGPLPQLGGLVLEVVLRPEIAPRLVIGGIPYSRVPLAPLLLLLILILSVLTLMQLRRHQELVQLRERFISNVSHELRTPLQQILVFSELLRMRRIESEDEQRHSIEVIERETRRLIQLVDNVLGFSRAGRELPLESKLVDLTAIVRETVQSFEPLARTRRARLHVEADEDVSASADADAVRRILLNLLDNAVKYGPADQVVTVTLTRDGDAAVGRGGHRTAAGSHRDARAVLAVEDQGPGVPHDARERIFKPFHRLEREEQAAIAGSGVGLAIVHDLVSRMSGDVRVEDAPGGGARFVVTLPIGVQP
jgi:signal transduction histidine kinase